MKLEELKGILTETVKPMLDDYGKAADERLIALVDEKISAAVEKTEKAFRMEMHDNLEDDPKGGFKSFGHFLVDIAACEKSGGRHVTKELNEWERIAKAAGTGLSEADANYAGFLVPEEFRNTLMVLVEEENELLPLCSKMPMQSNIIKIPYVDGFDKSSGLVYGGVKWYWVAEEAAATESRPKVDMLQMELHTLVGLAYATEQLIADSPTSVEALLKQGFQSGLNYVYNSSIIRGTGAGQPLGLINSPCAVTVSYETGQTTANPILFENVVKIYSRSTNPGKSVWIANIALFPYLASMSLSVGTGGVPVWMPAGGISGLPYPTLFGRPIFWNDHCSDANTTGDIIFSDMSQYWIGSKTGKDIPDYATSIHLKFDYLQTAFRFALRMDGRSAWKTYYTPPQATTTYRSPIVLLQTRV